MDWINEEGGFNAEATDMPENVKSLVEAKGYKGVTDLADAYTNAASKLGVDPNRLATIPEKPDDADGWNNLFNRMGRPETPDGYKPEVKVHEGQELNGDLVKNFSSVAHEIGLTNSQISKIMQFQLDLSDQYTKETAEAELKASQVAEADLKNAQAKAWDDIKVQHSVKTDEAMKELVEGAKTAAEKTGLLKIFEKHDLMNDPETINALIALNGNLSDSVSVDGSSHVDNRTFDEKLKSIQENPGFNDAMHPDHQKLMKEYSALYGISA